MVKLYFIVLIYIIYAMSFLVCASIYWDNNFGREPSREGCRIREIGGIELY